MMNFWQAVALGAVQGITEFLPVSRSRHLVLLCGNRELGQVPPLFDLMLQVSAVAAIVAVVGARMLQLLAAGVDLARPAACCRHADAATAGGGLAVASLGWHGGWQVSYILER